MVATMVRSTRSEEPPRGSSSDVTDELVQADGNGVDVDDSRRPKSIYWREKNWGGKAVPSRCLASLEEAHVGGAAAISPAKFSEFELKY
jgi:hypothetical protein